MHTRIFHSGGVEAVRRAILSGVQQLHAALPADATVEQALEAARKLHQAGQFAESRAICYELLNRDPQLGDALHLLAASALAAQSPMLAVECLAKAVAAHPNSDRYFNDLGIAWLAAGRADEARQFVEEFGIAGWVGDPQVILGLDKTAPHIVAPHAVHDCLGEVRVVRCGQPVREMRSPIDRRIKSERGRIGLVQAQLRGFAPISSFEGVDGTETWATPLVYGGRLYAKGTSELVCYDISRP